MFAIGSTLAYLQECATPPQVYPMTRYVIARDQFYQASPTLVLQATNAGVRRPVYEAMTLAYSVRAN